MTPGPEPARPRPGGLLASGAAWDHAMLPEAIRPRTPSALSSPSGPAETRLLQGRLGLFAGIGFLIAAVFYAFGQGLVALGLEHARAPVGHAALLTAILLEGGTWAYCRGTPRPLARLRILEAVLLPALGALSLLMPAGAILEAEVHGMVLLLSVNLLLYTRSVFIPSSARRTLAVSAATALPLAVYALSTETVRFAAWKLVSLGATIAVATGGSAVIYGLRREVRHARQLGQYTLEAKLGEGGMGVVYRARHAMLRRPTAVKLLKPEWLGEASLRRFEREVQLTASLSHPNTVTVFDYGRTPEGVFYYAMEYLEGLGLDELVAADGPQRPGRVVHILRQVLEALAEAHSAGLVHRDVKPANVILCERGGVPDVAKVVDFGLVKDLDQAEALTHDGALVGTPHYLAPEAIGSAAADARSDIYSAGAVAYYLLTGGNVFDGRTIVEVCGHHLHTPPTPPSERLGRPLPSALEAWVLECLEKDPARRPQSATEAAARLERCGLDGTWTRRDARGWWVEKGRALAVRPKSDAVPSALTLSRLAVGSAL